MASRAVNGCNRHVKGNLYKLIRHTGQVVDLHLNFVQLREEFFRFLITVADPAAEWGGGVKKHEIFAVVFSSHLFTARNEVAAR